MESNNYEWFTNNNNNNWFLNHNFNNNNEFQKQQQYYPHQQQYYPHQPQYHQQQYQHQHQPNVYESSYAPPPRYHQYNRPNYENEVRKHVNYEFVKEKLAVQLGHVCGYCKNRIGTEGYTVGKKKIFGSENRLIAKHFEDKHPNCPVLYSFEFTVYPNAFNPYEELKPISGVCQTTEQVFSQSFWEEGYKKLDSFRIVESK